MKITNHTNLIPNNTNIISLPAGRQVVISDSIRTIRDLDIISSNKYIYERSSII